MKKIFLISVLLLSTIPYSFAQKKDSRSFCYDETYSERIRVKEIDMKSLNIVDKVKFTRKEYVTNHREYINDSGYFTHDIRFKSHENMFPKWYVHPSIIKYDQNGIKSFFETKSKYFKDGWEGNIKSKTEHGEYLEVSGKKFYYEKYSELAARYYQQNNDFIQQNRIDSKFIYKEPTADDILEMKKEGIDIQADKNIVTISSELKKIILNKDQKEIVYYEYKNKEISKAKFTKYTFINELDDYYLSGEMTIIPKKFSNGDSYELVITKSYNNFSNSCNSNIEFRSSSTNGKELSLLEVYPNPVNDVLNVNIPASLENSTIEVLSNDGEIVLFRKIGTNISNVRLKIAFLPSGIFFVRVKQSDVILTTKFVKL